MVTFTAVQEIRELLSNPREMGGIPVRVFPLSGVIRCGFCGTTMSGVSANKGDMYYPDANQLEKRQDCSQSLVKAGDVERQVVDFLNHVFDDLNPEEGIRNVQKGIEEAEQRYERAKFLFLSGDVSKEKYELEHPVYFIPTLQFT